MFGMKLRSIVATFFVGWLAISVAAGLMVDRDRQKFTTTQFAAPTATPSPDPSSSAPTAEPLIRPASDDLPPAEVLDLTDWKLTLPSGSYAGANEVEQPGLSTFKNEYFRTDRKDDGVVFTAPAGGATTSGSGYPRSELREMTDDGRTEASWSNESGTHVMKVTQAINALPTVKPHVVAGQIHDAEDDVVMVRLEGRRLFVEARGYDVGTLDDSYELGTRFTITITATPQGIATSYNGETPLTYDAVGDGYYFKAGCYTQSNVSQGEDPESVGSVEIYDLSVSHS